MCIGAIEIENNTWVRGNTRFILSIERDISERCFPLRGILRAERNFSLLVNSEPEQTKKEKFRSARKIPPCGKQA